MTRDLTTDRRRLTAAEPLRAPLPRAERAEALTAALTGGLPGLDLSLERWLDRLEATR